jgi:prephenate dehydrogenase
MDVLIARLAPVTHELKAIREQLTRLADLYELYLQNTERLTTRITTASPDDLRDTAVDYSDPSLQRMIEQIEAGGKKVTDEQRVALAQLVSLESEDEE